MPSLTKKDSIPSKAVTNSVSNGSFRSSMREEEMGTEPVTDDDDQPQWKAHREEWLIVVSIFLLYLMIALDSTIIVPVLSRIAKEMGGSAVQTFWLGTSFLLTYAVFQPFIAVLSDIFGRRALMIICVVFFTAGTLIGCLAQNFPTLLAGRAIQGIGGGGIYVLGYVILCDIIPLRQRGNFIAIIQIAWAVGTILGPLVGGLFSKNTTWRWIFYINFPFCLLGFILVPVTVKLKMQDSTFKEKCLRVDWIGGAMFIASTTTFLVAVSWGGMQFPWNSVGTLAPLILGAIGIIFTLWWEVKVAKEPFLRKSLFSNRSAIAAYICALIQGLELFALLYYLPLYFEGVKGKSAVKTGISLFPVTCALVPASIFAAAMVGRTGRFRWAVWSGWIVTTLATGLLRLFDANTKTEVWAAILVVLGLGHGLVLSSLNLAVQAISDTKNVAFAVTMYSFLRAVGTALGVGIGGAIFQNTMSKRLSELGLPTEIARNAEAFIWELKALPDDSSFKLGVIDSYTAGVHGLFMTMTALCAVAALLSFLLEKYSMDDKLAKSAHSLEKRPKKGNSPIANSPGPEESSG